jgi:hypothetical protein
METVGAAIGNSFPVVPLENWNPCGMSRLGTGMGVLHVNLPPSLNVPKHRSCAESGRPLARAERQSHPQFIAKIAEPVSISLDQAEQNANIEANRGNRSRFRVFH